MVEYNPKKCPCCGDSEDKRFFKYSVERQENICCYCAEDEQDRRRSVLTMKLPKFKVRVDTKRGILPSQGANIVVEAANETAAISQAKQVLARMANTQVDKIRASKVDQIKEAS